MSRARISWRLCSASKPRSNTRSSLRNQYTQKLKFTFSGATEAHLLARELRHAGVGVLVHPRPFPYTWESRRMYVHDFIQFVNHFLRYRSIPGPPLTPQDFVSYLISQGVEVGIMPQGIGIADMDAWAVQNLRFDAGWVRASTPVFSKQGSAYHLRRFTKFQTGRFPRFKRLRSRPRTSTTCSVSPLRTGGEIDPGALVATKGGDLLGFEGKVVAVLQKELGVTHTFE
jgi:hypothetical protein